MRVAQQDQWRQDPGSQDDGAILRLEAALRRIAAAAGRRQDELRVAELTARAAQHEAEALQRVDEQAVQREEEMRELAARLDGLIAMVRAAIPDWTPGQDEPVLNKAGAAPAGRR